MRSSTTRTLTYLIAANFQAAGLIGVAFFGGSWLNDHYPISFAAGWYPVTFGIALVAVAYTYAILVRAAWRAEKRLQKEKGGTTNVPPPTPVVYGVVSGEEDTDPMEASPDEGGPENDIVGSCCDEFDLMEVDDTLPADDEGDPEEEGDLPADPEPKNEPDELDKLITALVDRELKK